MQKIELPPFEPESINLGGFFSMEGMF